MKRYECYFTCDGTKYVAYHEEERVGSWVKYVDIYELLDIAKGWIEWILTYIEANNGPEWRIKEIREVLKQLEEK